jgi:catechol 2,3-dioxygenase-like lactoylglutathione lyase family enzyme
MPLNLESIHHVQITVPRPLVAETLIFYEEVLGLARIEKPAALAKNGGAWYRVGSREVHVSADDGDSSAATSKRHVCFVIADLREAETELARSGVRILPDKQPIPGWTRFYIRDPGGNRIEIAQRLAPGQALTQPSEEI